MPINNAPLVPRRPQQAAAEPVTPDLAAEAASAFGRVLHDLRSPLSAMLGWLEVLEQSLADAGIDDEAGATDETDAAGAAAPAVSPVHASMHAPAHAPADGSPLADRARVGVRRAAEQMHVVLADFEASIRAVSLPSNMAGTQTLGALLRRRSAPLLAQAPQLQALGQLESWPRLVCPEPEGALGDAVDVLLGLIARAVAGNGPEQPMRVDVWASGLRMDLCTTPVLARPIRALCSGGQAELRATASGGPTAMRLWASRLVLRRAGIDLHCQEPEPGRLVVTIGTCGGSRAGLAQRRVRGKRSAGRSEPAAFRARAPKAGGHRAAAAARLTSRTPWTGAHAPARAPAAARAHAPSWQAASPRPTRLMPSEQPDTLLRPHVPPARSAMRILVVDDQPEIREMLGTWLRLAGATVRLAGSAGEARDILSGQGPFDAALIDLWMPDEDGYSLARSLRTQTAPEQDAPVRLYAISADATEASRGLARAAGFDDFFAKPLRLNGLASALGLSGPVPPRER